MSKPLITIAKNATTEMTIRKSRFISSIHRTSSEDEAKQFIDKIATNNRKANHNCFAYQCGANNQIQRESDNGEPSGTAGVPILKALQMEDVHNAVIVVTRYFGGIKLGAGGLIRAYSNSATNAIHEAGLVQCVPQRELKITSSYSLNGPLNNWLKKHDVAIDDTQFAVYVTTIVFVDEKDVNEIINDLTNQFNDQLKIKKMGSHVREVPLS